MLLIFENVNQWRRKKLWHAWNNIQIHKSQFHTWCSMLYNLTVRIPPLGVEVGAVDWHLTHEVDAAPKSGLLVWCDGDPVCARLSSYLGGNIHVFSYLRLNTNFEIHVLKLNSNFML